MTCRNLRLNCFCLLHTVGKVVFVYYEEVRTFNGDCLYSIVIFAYAPPSIFSSVCVAFSKPRGML